jgi:thiamine pyrophosphokinase
MKSFDLCKTALVANGYVGDDRWLARRLDPIRWLVAVDGGLNHLFRIGRAPDYIIGDFDSVDPDVSLHYAAIERMELPREKDQTDLEVALAQVMELHEQAMVFAALGLRTDHLLANLQLLVRYPGRVLFEGEQERLVALAGQCVVPCRPGQVISLFSLGSAAQGVTTRGLKWELSDADLSQQFFSISNMCLTDTFSINVAEGSVICCLNIPQEDFLPQSLRDQ